MAAPQRPVIGVIDDDVSILDAMTRLLPVNGFDLELYVSTHKFLETIRRTQASCLIVNATLRESCGVDFVQRLAKRGITFPIIFIATGPDEELEKRAKEAGCAAFLRKPFSAYLLVETLNRLLESYSAG